MGRSGAKSVDLVCQANRRHCVCIHVCVCVLSIFTRYLLFFLRTTLHGDMISILFAFQLKSCVNYGENSGPVMCLLSRPEIFRPS